MGKKNCKKSNTKKEIYKKKMSSKKSKSIVLSVLFFGLMIIVFVGGIIGYFYTSTNINPVLKDIYRVLPLPIIKIESDSTITSQQLIQDTEAVKKFYESSNYAQKGQRVDFSTSEGKIRLQMKEKDILNKLIENNIVQKIAKSKGINISSEDINKAVEDSLKISDSDYKKLALNLESSYGWSIDQFKKKIVKNQLYLEELFQWYKNNLKNSDGYERAEKAKNSISEDGDNFNEVVSKFSDGESAEQDGRIPWVDEAVIIPEVADKISLMEVGEISNIITSPLGMHIIMLEKRRETKDEDNNIKKEIQLKQIFIRGKSFIDWIQEQKKQMKIEVLSREYKWNVDTGEIEFSNSSLRSKAKKIKIKSQGDPSL